MGLSETFDWLASTVILSSLLVGFWEVGSQLGSVSTIVEKSLTNPIQFGLGTTLFYVAIDTWTPVMPASFLGSFSFLSWFYWFTGGYLPHYSLEAAIFSLIVSIVTTWFFIRLTEHEFWGWGLPVAIASFFIAWYVWTLLMWWLMFKSGEMIGLTSEQVWQIWKASAESVQSPFLQYFFLSSIPLSFGFLLRRLL